MISRRHTGLLTMFLLLAAPMWITGGTQPAWQLPLPILGAVLLGITVLAARRALLRDPVAISGGLFLLLLLVQWANSNRAQVFDPLLQAWTFGPPPVPQLPSSVTRADAAEMLRWFFPVLAIALAARHLVAPDKAGQRRLLQAVLIAAALLATGSMLQFAMATQWDIGQIPSRSYFVASFGYANQAGSFFVLCFCVALGWSWSSVLHRRPLRQRVIPLACALLCFGGVLVSLSRAAILMSLAAIAISFIYILLYRDPQGGRAARFNRIMAALATLIAAFLLLDPLVGSRVVGELDQRNRQMDGRALPAHWTYSAVDGTRPLYRRIAVGILRDYPAFGAGGWAASHLGVLYVPAASHRLLQTEGAANTHNDLLQFLSEFGMVGVALLWVAIAVMATPLIRHHQRLWQSPRLFFSLLGLVLVCIHGFFDLPFRSPAVLYLWTLVLALAGSSVVMNERSHRPCAGGEAS